MPEILKKASTTGNRFTTISDLQNNVDRVLFRTGNRQLSQKFSEKVYSPQVPKNWKLAFPVNSLNFEGSQLSVQFKNYLQKSRSILVP